MGGRPDAWMPFYVADYLRKTMHLTRDQHGGYLLLLMACWNQGGRLPNDDRQLAGIAKASMAEWRKLAPVLRPFFEVEGDCLIQGRVIEEREKAARLSEARRQAGAQGGRPRKQGAEETESKQEPIAFAKSKQRETPALVALPSPSQSSEPIGSGAEAPTDLDGQAWAAAVMVLTDQGGMAEKAARSLFGKLLSESRLEARDLLPSVTQAIVNRTQDPQAYLRRAAAGISKRRTECPQKRVGFV